MKKLTLLSILILCVVVSGPNCRAEDEKIIPGSVGAEAPVTNDAAAPDNDNTVPEVPGAVGAEGDGNNSNGGQPPPPPPPPNLCPPHCPPGGGGLSPECRHCGPR